MKRRVRKIANFFAFNLLFFALYLNFIHKDKSPFPTEPTVQSKRAALSGTVLVENQDQYAEKKEQPAQVAAEKQPDVSKAKPAEGALKLSIN
jgi:hypothetical protein